MSGEDLVAMHEAMYDSEDLLQTLLAKYPDLLAGGDASSGSERRWLLVKREVGVPDRETGGSRWSLDHLFIDQEAVPTLVEVKWSDDTRIRREVVGQMLDYAANGVVYWPAERLRSDFEGRCAKDGKDPDEVFRDSLGEDLEPERFWDDVEQNLRSGRVRLLFVSDRIPAELRRVIEFLNERMSPTEVLGIEIKQYVGEGNLRTLVPRLVGQTEQARIQKVGGGTARSGDVDWDYYNARLGPERFGLLRAIYDRMAGAIAAQGFTWQSKLKGDYLGFYPSERPGMGYRCGVNIYMTQPMRFWIKLPDSPAKLRDHGEDVPDLYPELVGRWDGGNRQFEWSVASIDSIPDDLGPAVSLTSRYLPGVSPMPAPAN